MPRAPRFWGPPRFWGTRAFGGPALTLFYFFPEFFCSMFYCETQTVRQCGALKSPSPPENARAPKFKKRGPIKLGPNVFCSLFQCFSVGPQRAQGPLNLKIEVPNGRAQNGFFVSCFSAGSKQRGAPKSPRPLKAKPPNKKNTRPQSLKSEAPKAGPQTIFFYSFSGQGAPKSEAKKS